MLFFFLDTITR